MQFAGVYNRVLNKATGLQFAGLANKTTRFIGGLQFATLANMDQQAAGIQLAGLMNSAVGSKGIAIAGLTNIARDSSRIQIAGLINKSRYSSFLQFSSLNIAEKVRGIQLGLINMADSSDYAVGVINIIKNGEKSISLSTDQSFFTHADFRSGGKVLYGLIGFGYQPGAEKIQYALNVGIGVHVMNYEKFFLDTECEVLFFVDFSDKSFRTSSAMILPGYKLNKHWEIFAGPAINFASADKDDAVKTNGWIWSRSFNNEHVSTFFFGFKSALFYDISAACFLYMQIRCS
ncbi:hypothetical protein [Pedobacter sp. L105]|uniref:hypothetical protein n=1 Tax=Pedobacter sp. L105 TaxID=1641871 RepID=UPI00131C48B8|nr:hypothetical protein [Pedobacter sp. L105]